MPVYSYQCSSCNSVSDVEKGMVDPHPLQCPVCGYKGELGRIFPVPGITFRGSGFYTTDKKIDEITDPEYQLSDEDQVIYYDEKFERNRKFKVFT